MHEFNPTSVFVAVIMVLAFGPFGCIGAEPRGSTVVGWRTDGTGRYPDSDPARNWAVDKNLVWTADLGNWSNATPVIVGERVFVCSERFDLACVSAKDGSVLWQHSNPIKDALPNDADLPEEPKAHGSNGYSTPTPVSDGHHIWALFGNGVVACYDLDGNRKWIRLVQPPTQGWGQSASPVLSDNTLIVEVVDVIALDAATGDERWRFSLGDKHSYGSPVTTNVGGTDIVITPTGDFLRARDGHVYARQQAHLEYNAPIVHGDMVYFITGDSHAFHMSMGEDGNLELEHQWRCKLSGDRYYASPVYHEGLIYALTRGQKLSVIDAGVGELVYTQKLSLSETGGGNAVYSSPTLGGPYVYLTGLDGTTIVMATGREYEELARNHLLETRSSPVFTPDRMYIRAGEKLFCVSSSAKYERHPR